MKRMILLWGIQLLFIGCAGFSNGSQNTDGQADSARAASSSSIKMVSWNLETFFDAQTDGVEYSDFKKSSAGWGRDSYIKRLDRLCEVINALDADVFVMQELENSGILYDISNRLAGNSWQKEKIYNYACFSKESGSAIGCAVLSKFSLSGLKVHSLDIRTEGETQPSMRPIMEVTVFAKGKPLVLFVNHWKSMSGGEAETEIWRCWEESVLGARISDKLKSDTSAMIACGDFNRDIAKFVPCMDGNFSSSADKPNVNLRYVSLGLIDKVGVYSPWIDSNNIIMDLGSYFYEEAWNHLDHFFSAGEVSIKYFSVENNGSWADTEGIPLGYKIYTGGGYSDHLPISCIVYF